MKTHWHASIENIAFTTLAAIVGLNLWRIMAAWMARQTGITGRIGESAGALVHFGA